MKYTSFIKTTLGSIGISEEDGFITNLFFARDKKSEIGEQQTPLLKKAAKEIGEYLAGRRKLFDLPLNAAGTDFQKAVWAVLREIPYGQTRNYKEVAEMIGNPNAARAVGLANNKNPIVIVIPCHRVIGANGKLVGYAAGLDIKEKLLQLEKSHALDIK